MRIFLIALIFFLQSTSSIACEYDVSYDVTYPSLEKITNDAEIIVIGKNYKAVNSEDIGEGFVRIAVSKIFKGEIDKRKEYIIVNTHEDMCHTQYFSSSDPMLLFLEKDYYDNPQFGDAIVYKPKYTGSSHSSFELLRDENGNEYIATNPHTYEITTMGSFEKLLD